MTITLQHDLAGVDWSELARLYQATLGPDEPQQLERTWLRSYATILAYDGARMVGAARAISDGEREALIVGVAVLPEYQRRGIGTLMMRDLVERLDGAAIVLTCSEDASVPFYRGLGFRTHKRVMVLHYPDDTLID